MYCCNKAATNIVREPTAGLIQSSVSLTASAKLTILAGKERAIENINIAIAGAGRMGQAVAQSIEQNSAFDLVGTWERGGDIDALAAAADVIIDFSMPEGTEAVVEAATKHRPTHETTSQRKGYVVALPTKRSRHNGSFIRCSAVGMHSLRKNASWRARSISTACGTTLRVVAR